MTSNLIRGNLAKTLILFSIPLILSGLLQQLYSWADAFIVGNVENESALAAIGATNVVTNLFIMAMTGFTSGVSILAARRYGTGDRDVQKRILSTFLILLSAVFVLLSILGIIFSREALLLLQTPGDILDTASSYLRIVLIGVPFLAIYNVYAAVLRGIGDSKAPFYSILVSSVMNVALDLLFVGVFRWSVEGAAAATVIAQGLMTAFVILYSAKRYKILRFRMNREVFDRSVLKSGCRLALPITIQSVVTAGGNLVLQNFMNNFGTATVAAITTAYRIDSVIMLPIINLGTGIATITSQNIGAGEYGRARKCLGVGVAMTAAISVVLAVSMLLFGGTIIGFFGVTAEAVQIGTDFFWSLAWFYMAFGLSMAMRGYLEGSGKVLFSGLCGIMTLGVRIGLSYALKPIFDNTVIAYAEAFSWCFQVAVYVIGLIVIHQLAKRKQQNRLI